ncbi:MAG: glycosyltransferase family 39 protein [Caldilineaceae bacterium]|nr:glycosyltransferase family 39 protein [Caldilineaceae bacterium]
MSIRQMLVANPTIRQSERVRSTPLALGARALLVGILLTGFGLRLVLLNRFAFHQDEAIYSVWALHGWRVDPLFLTVWPDKPPIYLWLLGWTFDLFGATPAAARFLNIACSTLTIAVVAALARFWWGARTALFAALWMALNPFAISFAPTAFTDPLLVLAGMLALLAAVRRRLFWAGVWLGIALMTKQQGVLFVPLVLAFSPDAPYARGKLLRGAGALLAGGLLVVAPVMFWDSLRWAVAPSPWDLGARNAAGFAFSAPATWLSRLQDWAVQGSYLLGNGLLWALALGAGIALVLVQTTHPRQCALRKSPVIKLALWGLTFLALHVITTVQIWDRYLLPLAPVVALLLAFTTERALTQSLTQRRRDAEKAQRNTLQTLVYFSSATLRASASLRQRHILQWAPVALAGLLLLMAPGPAIQAAQGRLPIGGDHGAYMGLSKVAAWLQVHADATPVIYHRNLGWHFRFELFTPVQEGRVDLRWYPSSVYLADNAAKTPHRPRYLVVADWSPERDLAINLALRRLTMQERLRAGRFTVYEISERAQPPAAWRVCRMPAAARCTPAWRALAETALPAAACVAAGGP